MSEVVIVVRDNGPLKISGPAVLEDAEGNRFATKDPFFLCRCGRSQNKPFCDGSHKEGFESAPRAR
ncbi:MAG: CDGSH iron-sulfur domain-containing protein [Firmicutes bacterium]|nr:CDGSH iron-sulfur domain-containing protein [Bacillota bacterium]